MDPNWDAEDLTGAMVRTLGKIHERTVQGKNAEAKCFTAPAFCYVFVFLRASLLSSHAKKSESFLHDGLQIMSVHSKMRGEGGVAKRDVYHPRYLPIKQMFELLIELISKHSKYWAGAKRISVFLL